MSMTSNIQYFPYGKPRPGQIELIKAIQDAVISGHHLCVEAANGFGKTIAALSGVLPFIQKRGIGAVYVARTHKQLDRVMEELKQIRNMSGIKGIVMRGRRSSCLNPFVTRYTSSARLAMFVCNQLKKTGRCSYFQNLQRRTMKNNLYALTFIEEPLTGLELRQKCKRECVCPYELTKMCLPHMAIVATTYYQIFDPEIRTMFFNAFNRALPNSILILDEAHNLPRIAVELASASLSLQSIRQAISEAENYGVNTVRNVGYALETLIQETLHNNSDWEIELDPLKFTTKMCNLARISKLDFFLRKALEVGDQLIKQLVLANKPPISYILQLAQFLVQWSFSSKRSDAAHFLAQNDLNPMSIQLEIVALDPRWATSPVLDRSRASIHLSGTLQPIRAHIDLVGLPKKTQTLNLPSPFSQDQILPLISLGVTTAMRYRTPDMFRKIAGRIAEACRATPHNVGVFVPSYSVLQAIRESGFESFVDREVFFETPRLTSSENDSLIKAYKSKATAGAVLLGVLGGRNSEGEDYPGNEMETVVVVGVPYAKPSPKEKIRMKYFEQQFPGNGRLYGYVLPAMRNASQAAGRSIRRHEDRGAIVFLDNRYTTSFCQRFLPSWISQKIKYVNDEDGWLFAELSKFYGRI